MNWKSWLELVTWVDVLDILIVAFVFYQVLLLIRGTRAVQMLTGLLLILGLSYTAKTLRLSTLSAVIDGFLNLLPIAVIVLFQEEIRRALVAFGRQTLPGLSAKASPWTPVIEIVSAAASRLARAGFGALIVLEREEGLKNYVESGVSLDAELSADLLVNIFTPDTPLHDGAVIVRQGRIAAASCFLPLSSAADLSRKLGSRHRAALGISEETDALAVVVSEEDRTISIAVEGRLEQDFDRERLMSRLRILLTRTKSSRDSGASEIR